MKLAGFLVGAGVAGLGVYAFNVLTTVTGDDLLSTYLSDHCLPYVQTGETPFTDIGRTPGVYDEVEVSENLENAGAAILENNRFVAEWGEAENPNDPTSQLRVCIVEVSYTENSVEGFVVEPDGFIARYTDVIATAEPLVPEVDVLTDGPRTIGWYSADRDPFEGLRVVMVARPARVSSVMVVGDAN
ncbi:hypothetical protein SAMN05444287_2950 [Octadecabacter temperatus]|uniref:Uncharacterized protein n=1 Tax=Octadecabacter temperatus TaxID=1458307 RepID=A0A0K0Y939_9RHOB|nr:hypothetical protein [Octadecabacter temperatus]AKS47406.1 hypothetical protein OSB_28830 [Octadecabacter temperatus]SIO43033.1 hypothetical protein SAMN05444287_2950 [Octadecabacter temperatus]